MKLLSLPPSLPVAGLLPLRPTRPDPAQQWSSKAPSYAGLPGSSSATLYFLVAGEGPWGSWPNSLHTSPLHTLFGGPELEALNWPAHFHWTVS